MKMILGLILGGGTLIMSALEVATVAAAGIYTVHEIVNADSDSEE